jgi:hypothetical protein
LHQLSVRREGRRGDELLFYLCRWGADGPAGHVQRGDLKVGGFGTGAEIGPVFTVAVAADWTSGRK